MSEYPIAHTVAELIGILRDLPQEATVIASEMPFTGVCVIAPTIPDGKVHIASLRDTPEGKEYWDAMQTKQHRSAASIYDLPFDEYKEAVERRQELDN